MCGNVEKGVGEGICAAGKTREGRADSRGERVGVANCFAVGEEELEKS